MVLSSYCDTDDSMDLETARLAYADTLKEIHSLVEYAHRLLHDDILNNRELVRWMPAEVLATQRISLLLQALEKSF